MNKLIQGFTQTGRVAFRDEDQGFRLIAMLDPNPAEMEDVTYTFRVDPLSLEGRSFTEQELRFLAKAIPHVLRAVPQMKKVVQRNTINVTKEVK